MIRRISILAVTAVVTATLTGVALVMLGREGAWAADLRVSVPPPRVDEPLAKTSGSETAILSGGCFWGMQLVFQHVKGVRAAVSGYTGGAAGTAHYDEVSTGTTGHAESIEVVFDPHVISYGSLLRIYFSVATDPTELNHQGPDDGIQYRGEVWPIDAQQRQIAELYVRQLTEEHVFRAPIVTRIESAMPFYPAESYHQNFATLHPDNPYIMTFDAPKATALARMFPELYRSRPTLITASAEATGAREGAAAR